MEKFRKSIPVIVRTAVIIIVVCYFIPFCMVTCDGEVLTQLSPLDMTKGREIEDEKVGGEPMVLLLLILPLLVFCFSFIKNNTARAALYTADGVALLVAVNVFLSKAREMAEEFWCDVSPDIGYYLFMVFSILIVAVGIIDFIPEQTNSATSNNQEV